MQRIVNTDKALYLMEHYNDGTGRMLFGFEACADEGDSFVDVRVASGRHSSQTMIMPPDVALLAYRWLGQWLASQGVELIADRLGGG